jgi:hypothetical protein
VDALNPQPPRDPEEGPGPHEEGPGPHDADLFENDSTELVRCVYCGKYVNAYARRCHHCRRPFEGEAWQAGSPLGGPRFSFGWRGLALTVLFLMGIYAVIRVLGGF